jgi:hypothetical protein
MDEHSTAERECVCVCVCVCECVCVEHTSTSSPDKYIHLFDTDRPLPVSAIFITCEKLPFCIRILLRRTSTVKEKSITSKTKPARLDMPFLSRALIRAITFTFLTVYGGVC